MMARAFTRNKSTKIARIFKYRLSIARSRLYQSEIQREEVNAHLFSIVRLRFSESANMF